MLEIVLYGLLVVYALHLLAAFVIWMVGKNQEERKAKEIADQESFLKMQEEDNRIEAMRKEREAAYYARIEKERRAFAPTTVMLAVPPPPPRKKI